jgi:tetratricopeptide (TPR) repeat protein
MSCAPLAEKASRAAPGAGIVRSLLRAGEGPQLDAGPARDGRTITVAETLENAAKKLETELATQPERRAKLQATLGYTYRTLGLYREALPLREKVRDYSLATFGPEHPAPWMQCITWRLPSTTPGERMRRSRCRSSGGASPQGARSEAPRHLASMNLLGYQYSGANRRYEALKLQEECLLLRRKVNGPDHYETLWENERTGEFLPVKGQRCRGRCSRKRGCCRQGLKRWRRHPPESRPTVAAVAAIAVPSRGGTSGRLHQRQSGDV